MKGSTRGILIGVMALVIFTGIGNAQYQDPPVPKEGLVNQLKKNPRSPAIIKLISSNGVDFLVTPDVESELRAAGAKPEIIKALKDNYRIPGSNKRASYLTVTSNVDATAFDIVGVRSFVGNQAEMPIIPGVYQITASRPGYSRDAQTADLTAPGVHRTLSFTLRVLSISDLMAEAQGALQNHNFRVAVDDSREILRREPANAKANMLLAQLYYTNGNFDQSRDYFVKAVMGGESAVFTGDRFPGGICRSLKPGRLVLTSSSVSFRSGDKDDFDVPYSKIEELNFGRRADVFMKVRVPKSGGGGKGEDTKSFNFFPSKASAASAASIDGCGYPNESKFVVNLISDLRQTVK